MMAMQLDPSVNLGTMLHLGISLLTGLVTVAVLWGSMRAQVAGIREELRDIKNSLGCTDEDVAKLGDNTTTIRERLAAIEGELGLRRRSAERKDRP